MSAAFLSAPSPTSAAPAGTPAAAESNQRLIHAAQEFEGQMLMELLKPLTASGSLTGDPSDGGGILGEFASEALGKALSEHGGFGIANRIVAQLSHSGNQPASAPVTPHLPKNTGMRVPQ